MVTIIGLIWGTQLSMSIELQYFNQDELGTAQPKLVYIFQEHLTSIWN
jgi:hypothetical protein